MVADEQQNRYRDEVEGLEEEGRGQSSASANGTAARPSRDGAPKEARWLYTEHSTSWFRYLRPINIGFASTVRAVFNYPEPGLKLRSTAWLDGMRGLAAFEVFIFHYCDGWVNNRLAWGPVDDGHTNPSWWLLPFFRTFHASGDASVCLFFAISGFVLSHRMLGLLRQQRYEDFYSSLASAMFRRGIRLYLPVAIETFILMLLCRLLGLPKPVPYYPADSLILEIKGWWVSMVHLFLPLRWPALWYDILNRYDGHISWTIPLEFFGSLVTYLVLLTISRISSMRVRHSIFAVVITHAFAKDDWISAAFVLGMVFADWQLENEERAKEREEQGIPLNKTWQRFRGIFFPLLFVFGFYLSGMPSGNFRNEYPNDTRLFSRPFFNWISAPLNYFGIYADRQADRYILTVAGISSIVGVGETPFLRRVAMSRPVQYLGRISFGLYLCHIFMRAWLAPLNKISLGIVGLTLEDVEPNNRQASLRLVLAYIMFMLPAIPLNLIMGGMFERFLDTPSVNAAKRLEKWCMGQGQKDVLPAKAPRRPQAPALAQQETGIAMVDMSTNRRQEEPVETCPAPPPTLAHRSSLAPPTDFEDEAAGDVGEGSKKEGETLI